LSDPDTWFSVKKYVSRGVFLKKERDRPADTHFWTGKSVSRDDCERARSRERKRREKGGKKGEEIGKKKEGRRKYTKQTDVPKFNRNLVHRSVFMFILPVSRG
jgi:hypothetical protein